MLRKLIAQEHNSHLSQPFLKSETSFIFEQHNNKRTCLFCLVYKKSSSSNYACIKWHFLIVILEDIHVVPNPPLVSHQGLLLKKYSILYFIPKGDLENIALLIYRQSNNQTTEQTHT